MHTPKTLTTQALMAAKLARDTDMPIDRIVEITKRVHASASIVASFSNAPRAPMGAAQRAAHMLEGTGWQFDAANAKAPAIVRGDERIILVTL